jgi:hypothetical protein
MKLKRFWFPALSNSTDARNTTHHKRVKTTPCGAIYGRLQNLTGFRAFGCLGGNRLLYSGPVELLAHFNYPNIGRKAHSIKAQTFKGPSDKTGAQSLNRPSEPT